MATSTRLKGSEGSAAVAGLVLPAGISRDTGTRAVFTFTYLWHCYVFSVQRMVVSSWQAQISYQPPFLASQARSFGKVLLIFNYQVF